MSQANQSRIVAEIGRVFNVHQIISAFVGNGALQFAHSAIVPYCSDDRVVS